MINVYERRVTSLSEGMRTKTNESLRTMLPLSRRGRTPPPMAGRCDLPDDEILKRLFELNAAACGGGAVSGRRRAGRRGPTPPRQLRRTPDGGLTACAGGMISLMHRMGP